MKLAKQSIDIALFTEQRQPMLDFWQQQAGLVFEESLPPHDGLQQHRHALQGSVFKLNTSDKPLTNTPPGGIRELLIATPELDETKFMTDADGNRVTLVPVGWKGLQQIGIRIAVSDLDASCHFYGKVLGLAQRLPNVFTCGNSLIFIEQSDSPIDGEIELIAKGFRYLTIQVWDCQAEHQGILDKGGREGFAPKRYEDIAIYSMVRDPDGNWIEISQRASLTGSLDK